MNVLANHAMTTLCDCAEFVRFATKTEIVRFACSNDVGAEMRKMDSDYELLEQFRLSIASQHTIGHVRLCRAC